ncbi:MAG: FecR family protein [Bacteroidota bacterium]
MQKNFINVEDILADDHFTAWHAGNDDQKAKEWEAWMEQNPSYKQQVGEAVAFMNSIAADEKTVPEEQTRASLSRLNSNLDEMADIPVITTENKQRKRRWLVAASVAAILMVTASLLLFNSPEKKPVYATPFGQLEKHELPDGSMLTLNANSSVEISKDWSEEKDREVWLKGEAFFKVAKTKTKNRFIVHAGRLDVIVTGTQFNVITRGNTTSVLLTEGSVIIRTEDGKEMRMAPGDFIEFNEKDIFQRKDVNAEGITAWTDKKMNFENTPMEKAAEMIKEIYGVEVRLGDEKARSIVLLGLMPNDNLEVLLQSIEASQNCKIARDGNIVTITGKE